MSTAADSQSNRFIGNDPACEGVVPPRSDLSPLIFIIDDNVDAARMLEILLNHDGYQVAKAHDGIEALRLASQLRPMCVLLDVGLPGLNGFEVALRLRQIEGCEEVVIIGVTGFAEKSDQIRSAESGFDYHLVKPVEYDVVSSLISKAEKRCARVSKGF